MSVRSCGQEGRAGVGRSGVLGCCLAGRCEEATLFFLNSALISSMILSRFFEGKYLAADRMCLYSVLMGISAAPMVASLGQSRLSSVGELHRGEFHRQCHHCLFGNFGGPEPEGRVWGFGWLMLMLMLKLKLKLMRSTCLLGFGFWKRGQQVVGLLPSAGMVLVPVL